METEEINIGDVVTLKSGGPKMTVKKYVWDPKKGDYDKNQVNCSWFENEKVVEHSFQISQLTKPKGGGAKFSVIGD